jgi:hypothetical protein
VVDTETDADALVETDGDALTDGVGSTVVLE